MYQESKNVSKEKNVSREKRSHFDTSNMRHLDRKKIRKRFDTLEDCIKNRPEWTRRDKLPEKSIP